MISLNGRGVIVALVLCPVLVATSRADKPAAPPAPYPTLGATPFPPDYPLPAKDRLEVSQRIHAGIIAKGAAPGDAAGMNAYNLTAERAPGATIRLLPIPAGEFDFGSGRHGGGPSRRVKIEPFWIAQTELTWAFFLPYERAHEELRKRNMTRTHAGFLITMRKGPKRGQLIPLAETNLLDFLAHPSWREGDADDGGDFDLGPEFPAMCMTQHAASKFCQWLSAQTGHFYRLPTEAEWEYACRAGNTTTYSFGDDASEIDDYAWHGDNSEFLYRKVGLKKPNRWGLHDMHGNVAEWTLDGYDPDFRGRFPDGTVNPWSIPLKRYPRIVKGGSWDHRPQNCQVHSRLLSTPQWKDFDPQVPKNFWFNTSAQHVGFRIVRPLKTPSAEEMHLFWNTEWWDPVRNSEDLEERKPRKPES